MASSADSPGNTDQGRRPLVLTLELDPRAQAWFDQERRAYFPAGRTVVGAHVTLFHALPGEDRPEIVDTLSATADGLSAFTVRVSEPVSLGNGVAYPLHSTELKTLHRNLQQLWWSRLTRQDQQGFRAHVTVQNKVSPPVARRTLIGLRDEFTPFGCTAVGLRLWRYDGGPWTCLGAFPFLGSGAGAATEPLS